MIKMIVPSFLCKFQNLQGFPHCKQHMQSNTMPISTLRHRALFTWFHPSVALCKGLSLPAQDAKAFWTSMRRQSHLCALGFSSCTDTATGSKMTAVQPLHPNKPEQNFMHADTQNTCISCVRKDNPSHRRIGQIQSCEQKSNIEHHIHLFLWEIW